MSKEKLILNHDTQGITFLVAKNGIYLKVVQIQVLWKK